MDYQKQSLSKKFQVKKITDPNDPLAKTWHSKYDSAWVPPNCNRNMIPSGKADNCIKSNTQIRILGVCRGWDNLSPQVQAKTTRVWDKNTLGKREKKWLKEFVDEDEEDEDTDTDDDN